MKKEYHHLNATLTTSVVFLHHFTQTRHSLVQAQLATLFLLLSFLLCFLLEPQTETLSFEGKKIYVQQTKILILKYFLINELG